MSAVNVILHTHVYYIYSAGVGRTGTFITIDMVLQQIENEGIIDIPKIINGLRQQRMKMVQTVVSMIYNIIIILRV